MRAETTVLNEAVLLFELLGIAPTDDAAAVRRAYHEAALLVSTS